MERLWTPWRFSYISQPAASVEKTDCIFCSLLRADRDRDHFLLYRGPSCFVLLNRFPYTSGHLMISPYRHVPLLTHLRPEETEEMMSLAQRAQAALSERYRPEGFNIGMNLGACAGAGVAGHVHLHVVPRWVGDSNFMTVLGETRVLPETLEQTFEKLLPFFPASQ